MDLLMRYEIWLIAAVIFVAVDVLIGLDFILLAFGIGAATTGASLFWNDSLNLPYTTDWESLITFFGIFSLCILIPLRILVKRLQARTTPLTLISTDGGTRSPDSSLGCIGFICTLLMYPGGNHHDHNNSYPPGPSATCITFALT